MSKQSTLQRRRQTLAQLQLAPHYCTSVSIRPNHFNKTNKNKFFKTLKLVTLTILLAWQATAQRRELLPLGGSARMELEQLEHV